MKCNGSHPFILPNGDCRDCGVFVTSVPGLTTGHTLVPRKDEALEKVINAIPQQAQRQYSTDEQLRYLRAVANKLGLYDAADRLELGQSTFMAGVDSIWRKRS